jgi:teichuronic acid biosynthesis glycosyltransferase TuaG
VYNAANYIENTIKMVCDQTYKDWELILVDDASSDNSVQVIEEVISSQKKRIRLIKKDVNAGAAAARNTGIKESTGEWLYFCDTDDEMLSGGLQTLIQLTYYGKSIIFGGYMGINEIG